ncbi:hypothetical protein JOC58_001501 [Paenibacillus hunanensis]|uniref:Uncharacterized protein n=1 Tax=Paenibacillus hunanensis TaxID=539262 RepID=A0ABU1IZH5_9BACL|nr:hypothetical protein [Paenibacillus hunanensis]
MYQGVRTSQEIHVSLGFALLIHINKPYSYLYD